MKKYEILEHKADLKIRAFGKTKEEIFSNILFGMAESQRATTLSEKVKREIKITSPDLPSLLVDFLSEVLYLTQVNKEVYFEAEFKELSENKLEGFIFGRKIERFGEDIKGVTYHNLDIYQKEDGTGEAVVLFDI